ncbi:hypothetical protein BDK51DRAFT_46577 [Blyttiomyces helicus]|uniref:Uncharacterized protein n=1 Tax=Blyttiomyces helicus TaxID=388810 RepID=A0A4P9WFF1_9FUNG|nr:hypothetical protein BDK51DRAFT_46577 [Blyttiomyces helicus]|eukprot:RKO91354.1 hypothetical protein BDK51DRAFT_46577 [Blyttiomyces helicus]
MEQPLAHVEFVSANALADTYWPEIDPRELHRLTMSSAMRRDGLLELSCFFDLSKGSTKWSPGAVYDIRAVSDPPATPDGPVLLRKAKIQFEGKNLVGIVELQNFMIYFVPATTTRTDILGREARAEFPFYAVGVRKISRDPNLSAPTSDSHREQRILQLKRLFQWPDLGPDFFARKRVFILTQKDTVRDRREGITELVTGLGAEVVNSYPEDGPDIIMVISSVCLQAGKRDHSVTCSSYIARQLAALKLRSPKVSFFVIEQMPANPLEQFGVHPIWQTGGIVSFTTNALTSNDGLENFKTVEAFARKVLIKLPLASESRSMNIQGSSWTIVIHPKVYREVKEISESLRAETALRMRAFLALLHMNSLNTEGGGDQDIFRIATPFERPPGEEGNELDTFKMVISMTVKLARLHRHFLVISPDPPPSLSFFGGIGPFEKLRVSVVQEGQGFGWFGEGIRPVSRSNRRACNLIVLWLACDSLFAFDRLDAGNGEQMRNESVEVIVPMVKNSLRGEEAVQAPLWSKLVSLVEPPNMQCSKKSRHGAGPGVAGTARSSF